MTGEQYLKMEGDKLPYTTEWGFTIEGLSVHCPVCKAETQHPKYKLNEFTNSLDVVAVGICDNCKVIVTAKPMRLYKDNRFSWREEGGQWVVSCMKFGGMWGWIKNLITFFKGIR